MCVYVCVCVCVRVNLGVQYKQTCYYDNTVLYFSLLLLLLFLKHVSTCFV